MVVVSFGGILFILPCLFISIILLYISTIIPQHSGFHCLFVSELGKKYNWKHQSVCISKL